jgi:hypothetical protein
MKGIRSLSAAAGAAHCAMFRGLCSAACLAIFGIMFLSSAAFAEPTRDEAYRSDRLHIVIYKDSTDANTYWYLPPLKLYEEQGKVIFYKRPTPNAPDKTSYYFYVVPYMTDDLMEMLAGEVPNLQDRSQLKPVIARQFGIQVKQFNTAAMGDKITDYQYLNQPQLIKFDLEAWHPGQRLLRVRQREDGQVPQHLSHL